MFRRSVSEQRHQKESRRRDHQVESGSRDQKEVVRSLTLEDVAAVVRRPISVVRTSVTLAELVKGSLMLDHAWREAAHTTENEDLAVNEDDEDDGQIKVTR